MNFIEKTVTGVDISGIIDRREQYLSQRMRTCDPTSGTSDAILARFPKQHTCQYCREEVMNAFRAKFHTVTFLRSIDEAIKAAEQGCSLYEWLLDFVIRSGGLRYVVGEEGFLLNRGREGFFLDRSSLPGNLTDVFTVQFLIGTLAYTWPCASFDVFTESGQWLKIRV
jgi:hypothetical protein